MLRPTSAERGSRPTSAGSSSNASSAGGSSNSGGGAGVGGGGSLSSTHIPVGLQFTVSSLLTDTVGLLLHPPSGVTLNAILRLPAHCAMRAHISCNEWLNAAPTAMGLSEEVAVRLFEAFSLLWQHQGQRFDRRIEATRALLLAMSGASSSSSSQQQQQQQNNKSLSYTAVTAQRAVSLPGFMIFLAAQTFLERASLNGIAPGTQQQQQQQQNTAKGNNNPQVVPPETYAEPFLAFVRENLSSLMSFLCMGTPGRICVADLAELRLLFREWDNGVESPFSTKLQFLWNTSGVPSGVSPPAAATIESQVLIQLLRSRLCLLSELRGGGQGPASSLLLYRGVAHQTVHTSSSPSSASQQQQVASNSGSVPPRCSEMHNCVRLQRCTQSTFFILQPLPSVVISHCTNCIIFLGPVAGVLVVDRCEHCQIIALCAGVVVQGGKNVTLYLGSNTPPILVPSSSSSSDDDRSSDSSHKSQNNNNQQQQQQIVHLAPYNTCYPSLEDNCLQAKVNPKLNLFSEKNRNTSQWASSSSSTTSSSQQQQGGGGGGFVSLLPPGQFCSLVVPPAISGNNNNSSATSTTTTRTNPVHMPTEYQQALTDRVQKCSDVSQQLLNAYRSLESGGRQDLAEDLRKRVQTAFVEWLEQTGQVQGLADLLTIGAGGGGTSSSSASSSSSTAAASGTSSGAGGGQRASTATTIGRR